MEFLVDMVTTVPDGTSEKAVADTRSREAARSKELAAQGHLLRLWRPPLAPGEWRTWGLFRADDTDQLEEVLASMPLRIWRHDTVTPLSPHPSDPGLDASYAARSERTTMTVTTTDSEILGAVLDRWKSAVDWHEPQRVASYFTEDAIFQGLHPFSVGRSGIADYYESQPLGMTAAYGILETRRLADDVVLGYARVDFSFADRPTLTVYLGVITRQLDDEWKICHYQVSRLPS